MKHETNFTVSALVDKPKMTKREKLMHWARIVMKHPVQLRLYYDLEHLSPYHFRAMMPADIALADRVDSVLSLAALDPVFQKEGLSQDASIADILAFFEISPRDLHGFACGCHGGISNGEAAYRISCIGL